MTLEELDIFLNNLSSAEEIIFEFMIADQCMWSCEITWTPKPNEKDKADLSFSFFATGGSTLEDSLTKAFNRYSEVRQNIESTKISLT